MNVTKGAAGGMPPGRYAPKSRANLLAALFVVLIIVSLFPQQAFADGGVHCVGVEFRGSGDNIGIHPVPDGYPRIWVLFDKNVSYARPNTSKDFVYANIAHVHVRKANGKDVQGCFVDGQWSHPGRREIVISFTEWLEPLTTYQIVVDAGIQAANGEDISTEAYVFDFVTNDLCKNGHTVAENILAVSAPTLLGLGLVVQTMRTRKAL